MSGVLWRGGGGEISVPGGRYCDTVLVTVKSIPQCEIIWWVITHVPYYLNLKLVLIRPKDVVTPCPQKYDFSHLRPCLHVVEPPDLSEGVKEVHQPKLCQQIRNLLAA